MTKEELVDLLQDLVNAAQFVWDARDKSKTNALYFAHGGKGRQDPADPYVPELCEKVRAALREEETRPKKEELNVKDIIEVRIRAQGGWDTTGLLNLQLKHFSEVMEGLLEKLNHPPWTMSWQVPKGWDKPEEEKPEEKPSRHSMELKIRELTANLAAKKPDRARDLAYRILVGQSKDMKGENKTLREDLEILRKRLADNGLQTSTYPLT